MNLSEIKEELKSLEGEISWTKRCVDVGATRLDRERSEARMVSLLTMRQSLTIDLEKQQAELKKKLLKLGLGVGVAGLAAIGTIALGYFRFSLRLPF